MRPRSDYVREMLSGPVFDSNRQTTDPAAARKLVDGAVEYALRLGLAPHPNYRIAKNRFGAIDAAECAAEFYFGKDSKPFYVAGPNESAADSRAIIATLIETCGEGGLDYLLPI